MIPEMIPGGLFSEGAFDRLFQVVNSAMDSLFHGAFLVRHDDGLAAVAPRLDHAAFVVMTRLLADGVAEMNIDPPDAVVEPVQRCMHKRLHVIGKLFAAFDVAVCPDLDQHRLLRRFMALKVVALFDAAPLEEALVRRVLSYVRRLALLCRIDIGMLGRPDGISEWSPGHF
jgi:hypothetical protein